MVFVACGLNHKTAPLDIREKIARLAATPNEILQSLINVSSINEASMLSTCNRLEFYCDSEDPEALIPWLIKEHGIPEELLCSYFYSHYEEEGVRHALRVASGLDSMMLGEPQILGQMKQAYQQACQAGTIKGTLRRVFEYVFSVAKRIRHQSGIGINPVSIASSAVQLLNKSFDSLEALPIFLIGSGETASLVAKYLDKQGAKNLHIASRTLENAYRLSRQYNKAKALSIGDIPTQLAKADVVISATACPLPFIHLSMVEQALQARNNRPMFFIDLAVPRDIEPSVGQLEQVQLFNVDYLQNIIEQGMEKRRSAALQAEQLIDYELSNYLNHRRIVEAQHVICDYRERMQSLANEELKRAKAKLRAGLDQEKILNEFSQRMLDKLAHHPTIGLKKAAIDGRSDLLSLVDYLFNPNYDLMPHEEIT